MTILIRALLAATALMPIAAQAQENRQSEHRSRVERPEGRQDRPRQDPRAGGGAQRGPQGWEQGQQGQQPGGGRDQLRNGQSRPVQFQGEGRQGYGGSRHDFRGENPGGPDFRSPDARGNPNNGFLSRPGFQGERGRPDRGRPDRGQAWGNQGYRGNAGGYEGRGDRGGAWNRGWRGDNRYNWNSYRQVNRGAYRLPRYYAPGGWGYGYRRFSIGATLSSVLWGENYWIDDPYAYRLPDAYGPYRWVRYYDDAMLVDLRSGRVVDVVYEIFW